LCIIADSIASEYNAGLIDPVFAGVFTGEININVLIRLKNKQNDADAFIFFELGDNLYF
jgi:hypothetical protein